MMVIKSVDGREFHIKTPLNWRREKVLLSSVSKLLSMIVESGVNVEERPDEAAALQMFLGGIGDVGVQILQACLDISEQEVEDLFSGSDVVRFAIPFAVDFVNRFAVALSDAFNKREQLKQVTTLDNETVEVPERLTWKQEKVLLGLATELMKYVGGEDLLSDLRRVVEFVDAIGEKVVTKASATILKWDEEKVCEKFDGGTLLRLSVPRLLSVLEEFNKSIEDSFATAPTPAEASA